MRATTRDLREELSAFVRTRRVRYTIAPEQVIRNGGPLAIGFDVRLFAWHGHDAHAADGCRICAYLEAHLGYIAEFLVGRDERPAEVEIDPEYAVLYDSRDAPGTDDVVLDLRLLRRGQDDCPVGPAEERYLRAVKKRLEALGIHER